MQEYYEIPNSEKLESYSDLLIPQAQQLVSAIEEYRNTTIIDIFRIKKSDSVLFEYIVIDIECDGVPPNNIYGIEYRERLALIISEDAETLVEVWALRKDFPELMHQNDSPPNAPRNLCLYFEPATSVMRTWTPKSFLKRIKWWIEISARGELHPADQPVEQLFFVTKYELVLPWDYDEIKNKEESNLSIICHSERNDGGKTFLLDSNVNNKFHAEHIDIDMPPILHGHILCDQVTLGGLYDQLNEKNIDLISALSNKIKSRVNETGIDFDQDTEFTVFLLHIPIKRTENSAPEKISHRAFIVRKGYLKLGEEIGALFHSKQTDNKYYIDPQLGTSNSTENILWHDEELLSMSVYCFNDSKRARAQSGIIDEGTNTVLIGAGSLGSSLLDMWVRSGWGKWSVIDKDHIKPHNLSRHQAYAYHVGYTKADVLSDLTANITQGENQAVSLYADALKMDDENVISMLKNANLVIDVSTTIEYPRKASENDELPRHISTFITPNGQSAVLLIEDSIREIKLRTLEAQYYRAVINTEWGRDHLGLKPGSFWSGTSCRDISFVLPYSKIINHAGNLAEQIQNRSAQTGAYIGIWHRDSETGGVEFHDVPIQPENLIQLGDFSISFDQGVIEKLHKFRKEELPKETGGILIGYYDFNLMNLVIVDSLPAPEDSDSDQSWFERGTQGLTEAVQDAANRTSGIVGYIGEWHSHPDECSTKPSQDDKIQLSELAFSMEEDGLPAVIVIVGKNDVNFVQGKLINWTIVKKK